MKKTFENRWIMIDVKTKSTWSATIANTKEMCRAMASESLSLDGRKLSETNFRPVRCTVTIEISDEDLSAFAVDIPA